jgi:hypothetical protein
MYEEEEEAAAAAAARSSAIEFVHGVEQPPYIGLLRPEAGLWMAFPTGVVPLAHGLIDWYGNDAVIISTEHCDEHAKLILRRAGLEHDLEMARFDEGVIVPAEDFDRILCDQYQSGKATGIAIGSDGKNIRLEVKSNSEIIMGLWLSLEDAEKLWTNMAKVCEVCRNATS